MEGRAINDRATAWNYLSVLPCLLLLLLFSVELAMALTAPVCTSPEELDGWCLPIGWEGPFADEWKNGSRSNAIINAVANAAATLFVLGVCGRRLSHPPRGQLPGIALLQLSLVLGLLLKGFVLNDPS